MCAIFKFVKLFFVITMIIKSLYSLDVIGEGTVAHTINATTVFEMMKKEKEHAEKVKALVLNGLSYSKILEKVNNRALPNPMITTQNCICQKLD